MADNLPNPGPCPFAGFQCEGRPIGVDDDDKDSNAWYTVIPESKFKKDCGIIFYTDAKGIWHNSRVLADQFALAGYHVVVVNHADLVRDEGAPFTARLTNRPDPHLKLPSMNRNALQWLQDRKCGKIGAVGYCAGAIPALDLANEGLISAAFVAHPGQMINGLFGTTQVPVSVAFGDSDARFDRAARAQAEAELLASGQPYQISLYSHVHHGFSQRRAFTSEAEVFAKKQSFIQAITWMEEHLHEALIKERAAASDYVMT